MMKRSERLLRTAWHEAGMAAVMLAVACACGIWAVAAAMPGMTPGGVALALAAATALFLAGLHGKEAARLARLAREESQWEWAREVRPRL
jgi:hypothetical protein